MKIIIAVSCFSKRSTVDVLQGSEHTLGSEYLRVLNSAGLWICLWFWMYQTFGYTRVLNMPLVLNMPWFWINQSSEYARVTKGFGIFLSNYWICLNMPNYVRICLNMPEYAGIACVCLNLPEWILFYISSIPHLFYNPLSTWTRA